MKHNGLLNRGIPIAPSLDPTLEAEQFEQRKRFDKKRLLLISFVSVIVAALVSVFAKLLIYLIDLITNVAFYGNFSIEAVSPSDNHLGLFVIIIPAIGGVIVGLMALFGSKAIRGHGIPEAMEQILTNRSKINPAITYLKPLSSAISIGTGGPFGAEGPIIATGGALGSTIGQALRISDNERKILLAAGSTAGMAAIFGTPVAAIFLAIELLLFEFSPRSLIPVAIACMVGAAGHHILFGYKPVFQVAAIEAPDTTALFIYSLMGIAMGFLAVVISKAVYFIEAGFEKLPIHWMWWPAIGGICVGIVGYFSPGILGVGYENITDLLSGNLALQVVLSLGIFKCIAWSVALGSGTSGGTLAPLLTIGAAAGMMCGFAILHYFPDAGITLPLSALVGMAAVFAGASRALLTSIIFALETTMQSNALLPLLVTCVAAYLVSFFLMEHTIMTEKIARRGVRPPQSYEPDILESISVEQVVNDNGIIISEDISIGEVCNWLNREQKYKTNYFIVANNDGEYKGILSAANLYNNYNSPHKAIGSLINKQHTPIRLHDSLRHTAEIMAKENVDVLPVISGQSGTIIGLVSYLDILATYKYKREEHESKRRYISVKRKGLKMLLRGQKLIELTRRKSK